MATVAPPSGTFPGGGTANTEGETVTMVMIAIRERAIVFMFLFVILQLVVSTRYAMKTILNLPCVHLVDLKRLTSISRAWNSGQPNPQTVNLSDATILNRLNPLLSANGKPLQTRAFFDQPPNLSTIPTDSWQARSDCGACFCVRTGQVFLTAIRGRDAGSHSAAHRVPRASSCRLGFQGKPEK